MSMRIVRFICLLALFAGVSLYRTGSANAEVPQDVQQACTPDAMRLCSQFIPDVAKITACMKAKRSQLSSACLTAMRGGRHEVRREARHVVRHERREVRYERHERHERHEVRREVHHYRGHRCDPYTHMCS
jgi:hypothetical protein